MLFRSFDLFMMNIMETREQLSKETAIDNLEVFDEHRGTPYIGYFEAVRPLEEKLLELSEIMRIYLKVEWNKAKTGK